HDDEGAATDARAIDVARRDAERLADGGRRVLAGGEDAIDVADLEPRVPHGVPDGFHVQGELALVGERAGLVAFVDADDAGGVPELFHAAPPTGWNSGRVISSVSLWKTTSTGMSQRIRFGSGSMPIRLDIRRGPSSSSTSASTYGGLTLKAL